MGAKRQQLLNEEKRNSYFVLVMRVSPHQTVRFHKGRKGGLRLGAPQSSRERETSGIGWQN